LSLGGKLVSHNKKLHGFPLCYKDSKKLALVEAGFGYVTESTMTAARSSESANDQKMFDKAKTWVKSLYKTPNE